MRIQNLICDRNLNDTLSSCEIQTTILSESNSPSNLFHMLVTILKILSLTLRVEGYTTTVFMILEIIFTIIPNETQNPTPK